MSEERITVVLLDNDQDAVLKRTLDSIVNSSHPHVSVALVTTKGNGARVEKITKAYKRHPARVELLFTEIKRPTARLNHGAHYAYEGMGSTITVFARSDSVFDTHAIGDLVDTIRDNNRVGIVTPMTNNAFGYGPQTIELPYDGQAVFDVQHINNCLRQKDLPLMRTDYFCGHCWAIDSSVLEQAGYFDHERFPTLFHHENDLAVRIQERELDVVINGRIFVPFGNIDHNSGLMTQATEHKVDMVRNGVAYASKHGIRKAMGFLFTWWIPYKQTTPYEPKK